MWEARFERFPVHPPRTREYYLLRSMFEGHFPHPDAIASVPQVGACLGAWADGGGGGRWGGTPPRLLALPAACQAPAEDPCARLRKPPTPAHP